jgi:ATP-dependent Clp protease adaptor protein ClpS
MAGVRTETETRDATLLAAPWNVVVHDDPVNLMGYVTWVFMRVFGYPEPRAAKLMMEVHTRGRSIVWTGEREKAEFYVQQLQSHQLQTTMEKAELRSRPPSTAACASMRRGRATGMSCA